MPQTFKLRLLLTLTFAIKLFAGDSMSLASDPSKPVVVKVQRKVLHRIDSRLFGQFMERPSFHGEIGVEAALIPGTNRLRPSAKALIRKMQIPIVRFPGGSDVEHLNWIDMVDNVPGRPGKRPVSIGHKGDPITNNFGYDEFLRLCEELEMSPILVVNFREGVLAENGPAIAARRAAKLVAYCNAEVDATLPADLAVWPRLRAANGHSAPYGVKYFQIGNETWNYKSKVSQDRHIAALQAYIDAIHAVDPSVHIIADARPVKLAHRVYQKFGDRISYFALHHYQPGRMFKIRRDNQFVEFDSLTARDFWYAWVTVPQIDSMGQSVLLNGEITQAHKLGYKIAVTEWNWNGWWAWLWTGMPAVIFYGRTTFDSLFAKGIGAAGILHALMRHGDVIAIATQSMLIGNKWDINAIYADRNGRIAPYMLPTGQVTTLYSRYHGSDRLELELTNMSYYEQPYGIGKIVTAPRVGHLDVLATRDSKTLYLHAINRHFSTALPIQVDITELEKMPSAKGTLHILEGRLNNEPEAGEPLAPGWIRDKTFPIVGKLFQVQLPARSVTVVEIPLF